VLVGFSTSDDAGIYKLSDDLALVQTVDFFTPIVDDPFDFGRIAAANALSDIYAMGAKPLTALNIAGFPIEEHGPEILTQILEGGAAILREAGVALLGGHTVKDDEPKYGLAVTGTVHPKKIVTNAKARPGDALVLTKPLGTGILAAALNAAASLAMLEAGAHAATDVTGFGLLGHAREMARASKVRLRFHASAIPVFALVREMVSIGIAPGGTRTNALEHAAFTEFAPEIDGDTRLILSDAQTSGGLLIALAPRNAERLLRALHATGVDAARIGEVEPGEGLAVEI